MTRNYQPFDKKTILAALDTAKAAKGQFLSAAEVGKVFNMSPGATRFYINAVKLPHVMSLYGNTRLYHIQHIINKLDDIIAARDERLTQRRSNLTEPPKYVQYARSSFNPETVSKELIEALTVLAVKLTTLNERLEALEKKI